MTTKQAKHKSLNLALVLTLPSSWRAVYFQQWVLTWQVKSYPYTLQHSACIQNKQKKTFYTLWGKYFWMLRDPLAGQKKLLADHFGQKMFAKPQKNYSGTTWPTSHCWPVCVSVLVGVCVCVCVVKNDVNVLWLWSLRKNTYLSVLISVSTSPTN